MPDQPTDPAPDPSQSPAPEPESSASAGAAPGASSDPPPEEPVQADALAEAALAAAQAAVMSLNDDTDDAPPAATPSAAPQGQSAVPIDLPSFAPARTREVPENISLLSDVNLNVKVELGRTRMLVEDVLKLGEGCVVELDKLAGDPVDVFVNDRHVARGELLVLNDNFCVRVNEIIAPAAIENGAPSGSPKAA